MATTFLNFRNYSWMSQASYRNFVGLLPNNAADLKAKLAATNGFSDSNKLATAQAEIFTDAATGFSFQNHKANDSEGFSATVFKSNENGEITIAVRGTEANSPIDLIIADGLGVVLAGKALGQAISAYRYYKSLTTAENAAVVYSDAEKSMLQKLYTRWLLASNLGIGLLPNVFLDAIPEILPQSILDAVTLFLTTGLATDQGLGVISPTDKVNFTGHSLGGHVATLLAGMIEAQHPASVGDVYTYNAPGQGGILPELLNWMGIDTSLSAGVLAGKITNIYGEGSVEVTAGLASTIGSKTPVFIESTSNPISQVDNHSIVELSDSLALYELFAKIDANLDMSQIDALFRSASNQMDNTLEKGLQSLIKLFENQDLELSTRDAYYSALIGLRDSFGTAPLPAHSYLVAPLATQSVSSIANTAGQDTPSGLAYRYALEQLNPFAIVTSVNLYEVHNTDNELDVYDPSTGAGTMTEQYLKDRAAFLSEVIKANLTDNDPASGVILIADDVLYQDEKTHYKFVGNDSFVLEHEKVLFGDNRDDQFSGGSKEDHLYGGGGSDEIHGNEGNDYIEGNAGNDWLYGDAGEDRLFGGDGSDDLRGGDDNDTLLGGKLGDFLTGGKGNDILEGGEGIDTYYYDSGDGFDIIRDSDGQGQISYKGAILTLQGATKISDSLYETANGQTKLTLIGDAHSQAGATLLIDQAIRVEQFHDGDLGIQLQGNPQQAPVQTGVHLTDTEGFNSLLGADGNYFLLPSRVGIASSQWPVATPYPCGFQGRAPMNSLPVA